MTELGSDTAVLDPTDGQDDETTIRCTAELAECTCPEFCERDHEND
jgi:hypothetical protein